MRYATILLVLAMLAAWTCEAQDTTGLKNIAAGAAYTMTPAPSYSHCTDPGDKTQLTDGVYTKDYFWVQQGTVGWRSANPLIITIDLGKDQPIRGMSFNTAAGTAGVNWPAAIYVLVAGEDKVFRALGNLVDMSAANGMPPREGYGVHRFWIDTLQTHGRYVAFALKARPYAFVDEIEVYEGDPAWLSTPLSGESISSIEDHLKSLALQESVRRQVRTDIEAVRVSVEQSEIAADTRMALLGDLDALNAEVGQLAVVHDPEFRAVFPMNDLQRRVFGIEALRLKALDVPDVAVWQTGLWDPLPYLTAPSTDAAPVLRVVKMANEYRAAAFSITNATQAPIAFTVRFQGIPESPVPGYASVHEVLWTGTQAGQPTASALPEAGAVDGGWRITAEPGLVRQVWITFKPHSQAAGRCEGAVELVSESGTFTIPLVLEESALPFPDRPALHFGGWDYTNGKGGRGVTMENMDQIIAHMREHFVDSPWGTSGVMPYGEYDAQGNMTVPPDTAAFDEWRGRWPDARQYLVFSSVGSSIGAHKEGAPEFDTAVQAWVRFWAEYMTKNGLEPSQLGLLILDEPSQPEQDARIAAWARPIRAANTGVKVWLDPVHSDMAKANQEMIALCDVLCPNRSIFNQQGQAYQDYFAERRRQGTELAFYLCSGPVRLLDPYAYHRLQAWSCWKHGAEATYFWAFGDNGGGSSWNEYAAPGTDYCPMFLDAKGVTPGKHMEACREGIEDYEYLVMLEQAIKAAEGQTPPKADAIERARALLSECPGLVLDTGTSDSLMWSAEVDRSVADAVRAEIIAVLEDLQQ